MPIAPLAADNRLMSQVAIRCHPCVPASRAELYDWLEEQVGDLRAYAPEGTIRLLRLIQPLPTGERDIGWLVELDLPEGESFLRGARCAALLRDLRLLGLQPTVLTALGGLEVAVPSHPNLPLPAAGDTWTDEWENIIASLDIPRQPPAKSAAFRRPEGHPWAAVSEARELAGEILPQAGAGVADLPRRRRDETQLRERTAK